MQMENYRIQIKSINWKWKIIEFNESYRIQKENFTIQKKIYTIKMEKIIATFDID